MATITLKGNPIHTNGELPSIGSQAPDFVLVNAELKDMTLNDFKGRKIVMNIFPSIDTPTCAMSTRRFNEKASDHKDAVFLMISADLPFAASRFCEAEGLENVETLSQMRSRNFAKDYGVLITDGPLAGITARAVVVTDANGQVLHTQLVNEIADEPDYDAALEALKA